MTQKYGTVMADCPWPGQSGDRHYTTMRIDSIKKMRLAIDQHVADDAHLWLWVTNATIPAGHEVLQAWGFTYRSMLTWVKPRLAYGPYLRNMTEHVLLGTRGKDVPARFHGQGSWLFAPLQDHSHKPEEVHAIVERMSPGPYLELFARRPHAGWSVWGLEVASDVELIGYPVPNSPSTRKVSDD